MEIEGEGHTFCNVLQRELLKDKTVEIAGYDVPHPLVASPIVYVRMKEGRKPEKKPETALREAAAKMKQHAKQFRTSLKKALKEWQQK